MEDVVYAMIIIHMAIFFFERPIFMPTTQDAMTIEVSEPVQIVVMHVSIFVIASSTVKNSRIRGAMRKKKFIDNTICDK